ncbi:hypothetical protein [Hyphococcus sp.]|uniref:hypothetical protein n=1 Tax=Hyphococcus sp. TaxID=2038636 RepID=UPI0035C7603C
MTFILGALNNAFNPPEFFIFGIIAVLPAVMFQMCWALSLRFYFVARVNPRKISRNGFSKFVFFAGLLGYFFMAAALVSGAFGLVKDADQTLMLALVLGMIVGNLSNFLLIGIAAHTFEKAEKGPGAGILNILISFLLIFYLPIGIWFIHPRLNRLRGSSDVISI